MILSPQRLPPPLVAAPTPAARGDACGVSPAKAGLIWSRLTGRPTGDIDLAVMRWSKDLARAEGAIWASADRADQAHLRRDLAQVGIGLVEESRPEPPPRLVLTLASDLRPAAFPILETLRLERLPLHDATRMVLGRRVLRRALHRYREPRERACRALLRGADELAWWDRRAWLPRHCLRQKGIRGYFRPVLFDKQALAAPRRGGLVRASDGAITRWAFA